LWFLPTYWLGFNSIEHAWGKLKAFLKQQSARTTPALQEAIALGLPRITSHNAQAWFRHCGYQKSGHIT
jgi:hypothetical protein